MKSLQHSNQLAQALQLRGVLKHLDELLHDAERRQISHLTFLNRVLQKELDDRQNRRLRRNLSAAHFPTHKDADSFDFGNVRGIGKSEFTALMDCQWVDRHENLLFFGPPGLGKTHLAIALGIRAIESGYTACFERMHNLVRLLQTSQVQRRSEFRINKLKKCNILIIDEIGYTPIDRNEANLFFSLISEVYENTSIVITSNKQFDNWAEMLGDDIMTTALLDRLLEDARIFSLSGKSWRMKKKTKKEVK